MRDYDKMDTMEDVQHAIANMLIVYIERYEEYVQGDLEAKAQEEAQEDAQHVLAYYDFFKDTLRSGSIKELEAYTIPYLRMIASGVKVHDVI